MNENRINEKLNILGIGGSLRKGSYNRALLRAAIELAPEEMEITIFDNEIFSAIPLYNDDVRAKAVPEPVKILKHEIQLADGLIFAIPEYNFSVSGVLKNAVDWVSRPKNESPLDGKPVALIGASTGISGTIRAQMHFRQICTTTNMLAVNGPQVYVAKAANKFDSDGRLIDEDARHFLSLLLKTFSDWIRKMDLEE
jgi:chromate reductase